LRNVRLRKAAMRVGERDFPLRGLSLHRAGRLSKSPESEISSCGVARIAECLANAQRFNSSATFPKPHTLITMGVIVAAFGIVVGGIGGFIAATRVEKQGKCGSFDGEPVRLVRLSKSVTAIRRYTGGAKSRFGSAQE
jgi:hypothetical protein